MKGRESGNLAEPLDGQRRGQVPIDEVTDGDQIRGRRDDLSYAKAFSSALIP